MLFQEIIAQKRDGKVLSTEAIERMIVGIADGSASEGQVAAFAMATYLKGMTAGEAVALTRAMTESGLVIDWSDMALNGPVVDKHSTGGIGDKVSLMLAPMVAACGAHVPMISGRGLGHTGGTLDKLESIPGYMVSQPIADFKRIVKEVGCAIVGQTADLAPADKRLYAVRDVTATVESIPLITASILCKKLASGLQALVMDVKTGSGAFKPVMEDSVALAQSIVDVASGAGLPTTAFVTEMGQPLGDSAGNALEIVETIAFLTTGKRDARLLEVVLTLGAEMLVLGKLAAHAEEARLKLMNALDTGKAAETFARMVTAQGGPVDLLEKQEKYLAKAAIQRPIFAPEGIVTAINTREAGMVVLRMGGGRAIPDDRINPAVGLTGLAGIGERVGKERPLAMIHAADEASATQAADALLKAYCIGGETAQVALPPVIHRRLSIEAVETQRKAG